MHQIHLARHHLLHFNEVHFDGWIAFVATAALVAAFVVGAMDFSAASLMGDPNLAP